MPPSSTIYRRTPEGMPPDALLTPSQSDATETGHVRHGCSARRSNHRLFNLFLHFDLHHLLSNLIKP